MTFCQAPLQITDISFWIVTSAALADSINPCAIAVLLILLGSLLIFKEKSKRDALASGLSFILAIYLAYFLVGLGLFSFLELSGLAPFFHRVVGIFAITVGLLNIKDFFRYGALGFVTEIPRSWRPLLQRLLLAAGNPLGAFLAGLAVTVFELPCTGGPYFFVLGLLSEETSLLKIIPVLLYYNLIFVLPLLLLTFLIYGGLASIEKANDWRERNIRLLHLLSGLLMLFLGIWVFIS